MTETEAEWFEDLLAFRLAMRRRLAGKIICVAHDKGGVGKSTLAVELAYLLGAILVDTDWHDGGSSRAIGYRHEDRVRTPLIEAAQSGRTPRPIGGQQWMLTRPELVGSGPDLETYQPMPEDFSGQLEKWAGEREAPVVIDTHPGGGSLANGSMSAANAVVVPALLEMKPLEGTLGFVKTMDGYPIIVVPNRVPARASGSLVRMLTDQIIKPYGVHLAPFVPETASLKTRKTRTAVSSTRTPSASNRPFIHACKDVAEEVANYVDPITA